MEYMYLYPLLDTTDLKEGYDYSGESHSLNKCILNIYQVPGPMLGDRQKPCPQGAVEL